LLRIDVSANTEAQRPDCPSCPLGTVPVGVQRGGES
jgi:hypothetical protein